MIYNYKTIIAQCASSLNFSHVYKLSHVRHRARRGLAGYVSPERLQITAACGQKTREMK
jgi:hypothetical protein